MSNPAHVVVAGTRRAWTREQKQAVLAEANNAATTVSAVARRHGIAPSLLFRWRREAVDAERAAALPPQPAFVPLCLPGPASTDLCERTQPAPLRLSLRQDIVCALTRLLILACCARSLKRWWADDPCTCWLMRLAGDGIYGHAQRL